MFGLPALVITLLLSGCGNSSSSSTSNPNPSPRGDAEAAAEPVSDGDTTVTQDDGNDADTSPESTSSCPPSDQWPEGMACIEGGTFTLGSEAGQPDEREPGEVTLSPFFMDLHEVANEEYESCVEARRCKKTMPYRGHMEPRQPRVATTWADAVAFCELNGKRLPTEAEWERAASGKAHTQYPWGDEPGGCEKAHVTDRRGHGCGSDTTLAVGSLPAGHFGLFDMAGNVHEWVADWYSPCLRGCVGECGDACFGSDPRGPCDGAERCPGRTKRSIRGGSWYWPEERARTTARRGADPRNEANHRFGFRCARDLRSASSLNAEVPNGANKVKASPAPPEVSLPAGGGGGGGGGGVNPLPEEARKLLAALPSEELSMPDEHYFHSNEWRHDLLEKRLSGIGGAYMGVGADQNYTMAALAGSELLLLVDFDPRIPRLHKIYEVLVPASANGEELVSRFTDDAEEESMSLLRSKLGAGAETDAVVKQYRRFRSRWHIYLQRVRRLEHDGSPFGWLADQEMYDSTRALFENGRIIARAGDVTGEQTVRSMGNVTKSLGLEVGVYYLSNAEQFFPYNESFIENIRSLPAGERSVVIRTARHARLPNARGGAWHYITHDLRDFRARLDTGAYRHSASLVTDLVSARPSVVGRAGISELTSAVPMRELEQRERRNR